MLLGHWLAKRCETADARSSSKYLVSLHFAICCADTLHNNSDLFSVSPNHCLSLLRSQLSLNGTVPAGYVVCTQRELHMQDANPTVPFDLSNLVAANCSAAGLFRKGSQLPPAYLPGWLFPEGFEEFCLARPE